MKRKLLLYLSRLDYPNNVLVASTLAWLCKSKNCLFDTYYDSYHQGVHFPGGDARNLEIGQLTGGTVCGDRHFEEFYFMLHNFDVSIIATGETIFSGSIKNLNIPVAANSDRLISLYRKTFSYLNVSLPSNIVMIGSGYRKELSGLEAYLYPEIFHRQAIGVPDSVTEGDMAEILRKGCTIFCFYVNSDVVTHLRKKGYDVEVVDELRHNDDYLSITERTARRWEGKAKGWILGDPTLVTHWIPTACEDELLAVYSVPQEKFVSRMGEMISSKGNVVYGRQYSDRDFFELSRLHQCLQVIDPCRPPFQSVRHVRYAWDTNEQNEGFYDDEYSDEELRKFASEGRVLISLMFWSGMIREVENFHNIMDLIAMTGLRCGLVVTAQSYEYMMHSPFEMLTVPMEQGGVYPLVEPVMGSCGIGVGIESLMTMERLKEGLEEGLSRILKRVKQEKYMPRGWWPTMDTDLEKGNWPETPKPFRFLKYPPYFQMRFHGKDKIFHNDRDSNGSFSGSLKQNTIAAIGKFIHKFGFMKFFEAYRPYEFYRAGPIRKDIIEAPKSVGLKYMFTKSGFNADPEIKYVDEDFIALNYTSGQWDGWTPFETVNNITDLKKSEKILLQRNKPGWIVSTMDSCLWTFSGEFWKRGSRLFDIAHFCSKGGSSGRLINVKPYTVSRYARIMSDKT